MNLFEKTQAVLAAYRRGETHFEGIALPSTQTTGTITQQRSHMEQLAGNVAKASMEASSPRETSISIIWTIEDVACVLNDGYDLGGVNLTDTQLMEILHRVDRFHDACVGINWDVIDSHIETYLNDKGIAYKPAF